MKVFVRMTNCACSVTTHATRAGMHTSSIAARARMMMRMSDPTWPNLCGVCVVERVCVARESRRSQSYKRTSCS